MRLNYVDAFTLLGDALHPAYGHPMTLARAYDHVYHEGREMGNLPLRGKKNTKQSMAVYREEYAQVTHRFYTLARIGCEKFVRPMPTSLVHPEMVYPGKRYEAYCLKTAEPGIEIQYEPVSNFRMDGLQPRIDLRPGTDIPKYQKDEVDVDPHFNEYPPHEEFVEGADWIPGQIPPKIRSPEYGGNSSDASSDTQASRIIRAVSLTTALEQPDQEVASTSAGGDTHKVELKPLPGLTREARPTWNGKFRDRWKSRVSGLSRMCYKDLPTVSCRLLCRRLPGLPSLHVSRGLGPAPGPLRPRRNQLGLDHLRGIRRGRNVKRRSSAPWPTRLQGSTPCLGGWTNPSVGGPHRVLTHQGRTAHWRRRKEGAVPTRAE